MQQIVHLKLSSAYPPEIREAAVLRGESGKCYACLKMEGRQGTIEFTIPLEQGGDLDLPDAASASQRELAQTISSPQYLHLLSDLRQLARSLE